MENRDLTIDSHSTGNLLITSCYVTGFLLLIPVLLLFHAALFRGMPVHELVLGLVNWAICAVPLAGIIWLCLWIWKRKPKS